MLSLQVPVLVLFLFFQHTIEPVVMGPLINLPNKVAYNSSKAYLGMYACDHAGPCKLLARIPRQNPPSMCADAGDSMWLCTSTLVSISVPRRGPLALRVASKMS